MPPKRKSYTAEFKLKIIKYAAKKNRNGAAKSLEKYRGYRTLTAMKEEINK